MSKKPIIVINGNKLTNGQAMTIRVAIEQFAIDLKEENALGDDETGKQIAQGYKNCINEIRKYIFG